MANLAFPQLSSGALVQYPFRKRRVLQSVLNTFADGSMIASNISSNTQRTWELSYTDLTNADQVALESHFRACQGPLLPFIFIDPTDNMVGSSSDLTLGEWMADPQLLVSGGAADPLGGSSAFTLVNGGETDQKLSQTIAAPASFQYCFSVYAASAVPTSVTLGLTAVSSQSQAFASGNNWTRLVSAMQLADNQLSFTVSITVPAAQTVLVWGPQLEPQISPSSYRATTGNSAVYQNAHLLGDSITFESTAPGLFSTFISIETT
jgi:hypothetical protein